MKEANLISPALMEQAEAWFGRLGREPASPADRQAFERWRATPSHAAAYAEVDRLWSVLGGLQGHPGMEGRLAQIGQPQTPRFVRSPWSVSLAASVLICILAGAAFLAGRLYVPTRIYVTEFGQRSTVQLEDGSEVILNSATRLEVKFAPDRRQFSLRNGEALFSVARDPARPFTVSAGEGTVTALGTRFQVRNESRQVIVTLLDGKIAVDRRSGPGRLELRPGEQIRFAEDGRDLKRTMVNLDTVSSWTTGRVQFEDATLGEVLGEVNRYSRTQLRLADPSLAALPINATFDMGNSASVVAALEALLPVEVTTRARNELVLTRR